MQDDRLSLWNITKYQQQAKTTKLDEVARESAVTVQINGEQYATIVCSPANLELLVIGFLASEGIIRTTNQINTLSIDKDKGFAYVELDFPVKLETKSERWIGSCCGKSREFYLKQDVKTAKTIYSDMELSTDQATKLMKAFDHQAEIFDRTGGVHQAALASSDHIIESFIDIGRHNALDKLYGYILKHRIPMKEKCILFSGRMSSEVMLKVSKMGAGILLAKSAPTDLALKLASDLNITAAGFVRENSLNVYTHTNRVYQKINKNVTI
ncbi:formate dehydrogenase accessory sulfurtransferase FdhD [Oceanobacillus halotolerans]|uniref:formate dehydrogenase accessory sulfurtransferase FdhD n=1 Tax=Oceanobacillus halotolerans TaxID=2663380 RepID=UPI0013DB4CE4|nr:formate dehydrogenase accessory sulfurtransferase FdhD [Oceanobacillus halotolerans]